MFIFPRSGIKKPGCQVLMRSVSPQGKIDLVMSGIGSIKRSIAFNGKSPAKSPSMLPLKRRFALQETNYKVYHFS